MTDENYSPDASKPVSIKEFEPITGLEFYFHHDPSKTFMGRLKLSPFERQGKELFVAAKAGDLQRVKEMLAENPDFLNWRDLGDESVLDVAVNAGSIAVAEHLIRLGANINAQSKVPKETLLMLATCRACRTGDNDILELLMRNGADLKPTDYSGRTARDLAVALGQPGVAELIDRIDRQRHLESQVIRPCHQGVTHPVHLRKPIALKK